MLLSNSQCYNCSECYSYTVTIILNVAVNQFSLSGVSCVVFAYLFFEFVISVFVSSHFVLILFQPNICLAHFCLTLFQIQSYTVVAIQWWNGPVRSYACIVYMCMSVQNMLMCHLKKISTQAQMLIVHKLFFTAFYLSNCKQ